MFLAISLHVWGVHAPEPQEPVYSLLASRVISSVLVSPPLPLAPPLQVIRKRTAAANQRVTLRTTLLNVPAVPGSPLPRLAAPAQAMVAVGTTGSMTAPRGETASLAPRSEPALPAHLVSASSGAAASGSATAPPAEVVADARAATPALAPLTSIARETPRSALLVLPADRVESDPRDNRGEGHEELKQKEVLAVVHEYTRALERLDVRATKAVYPSADDRRLKASFRDLEAQQIHLDSCGVSFSSSGANARCKGNTTYRPKIGPRVGRPTKTQDWVFSLSQDGGGWQILEARIQ